MTVMRYRLVVFDCDGTLTAEPSSWRLVHEFFGTVESSENHYRLYLNGQIDYAEFVRRDMACWPKPLHVATLEGILSRMTLVEDARHVVPQLAERGYDLAILSGGIDIAADRIGKLLDIRHIAANGFETTAEGYVTGRGIVRVDPLKKHVALADLSSRLGIPLDQTVAVGDSELDISFLQEAGLGVAVGSNEKLRAAASCAVESLLAILEIL